MNYCPCNSPTWFKLCHGRNSLYLNYMWEEVHWRKTMNITGMSIISPMPTFVIVDGGHVTIITMTCKASIHLDFVEIAGQIPYPLKYPFGEAFVANPIICHPGIPSCCLRYHQGRWPVTLNSPLHLKSFKCWNCRELGSMHGIFYLPTWCMVHAQWYIYKSPSKPRLRKRSIHKINMFKANLEPLKGVRIENHAGVIILPTQTRHY